jgi:nanoRNase/pAp phosphatase (c-di-AMP/oligoRNAs hydrolase)
MKRKRDAKQAKKAKGQSVSPRRRVRALLKLFSHHENVLVLINPDPDAMASAFAVKRLLWKHAGESLIAYIGDIQRLENRAMIEVLKIPMIPLRQVSMDEFPRRILVDSQPHHAEAFERFTYDAIIDHHPQTKKCHAHNVDIRPGYGANSTILIEYLRAANIKPSVKLATALLYGIKTDTANFERDATEEDVRQFRYVFKYANMNLLRKIEQSQLRTSDLRYFQKALKERISTKKGLYAHLGKVASADICVQVADFFMKVYGMGWSFVSGVFEGKLVVIIRNDGYRKDAGKLAMKAFGGFGSAGGHRGAARAEISLDVLRQKHIEVHDSVLKDFVQNRLLL